MFEYELTVNSSLAVYNVCSEKAVWVMVFSKHLMTVLENPQESTEGNRERFYLQTSHI